ncbi:Licodione synthase [Talaromyces islandicus]|uniref:Licodione synthase n=1 Tax=Talaromyces islandicus TaxID=28573 RepID=A0A0U1LY12_TALIS|nr:Licodione synthase [Talaromyces islandicus]
MGSQAGMADILLLTWLLLVVLLILYRRALPKPIPGIPYNLEATKTILGDIPALTRHLSSTKEVFPWMCFQNIKLKSPIIQLFIKPLSKPWVIITDYKEAQDILTRRTKEFDRSPYFSDIFHGVMPNHHITMSSTDERFPANRKLIQGMMSPQFVNDILAPQVYSATEMLIEFWKVKSELAQGRPFDLRDDIIETLLDTISVSTFGLSRSHGAISAQLAFLRGAPSLSETDPTTITPVEFPRTQRPPLIDAFITLTQSMVLPSMRRSKALKEAMISQQLTWALRRFSGKGAEQTSTCVLDDIVRREIKLAEKEKRVPDCQSRTIFDELYGFVTGGVDTTGSTLMWAIKYLSENQDAQSRLRMSLRDSFSTASEKARKPTVREITKARIPYLEAFLEETFRMAVTIPSHVRTATEDVVVLGHVIPKGTDVFLSINGPGFTSPGFDIDEKKRSESCASLRDGSEQWELKDMNLFRPERWLVTDQNGNESVNHSAAPQMLFSLGPRSCFGKRLGQLNMRVLLVLLVWHFEFLPLPGELISDDGIEKFTRQPRLTFVRLADAS